MNDLMRNKCKSEYPKIHGIINRRLVGPDFTFDPSHSIRVENILFVSDYSTLLKYLPESHVRINLIFAKKSKDGQGPD